MVKVQDPGAFEFLMLKYTFSLADLGESREPQFHAVFQKIGQFRMLAPPGRLALPPTGNSGSAPDSPTS